MRAETSTYTDARHELAMIVQATRDFSGTMPAIEWEERYPQFREMTSEDLTRELTLRLAEFVLQAH